MKSDIIIIGAGGHAKVCIELLRSMNETIAFCVGGPDSPEKCLDVPVLIGDENLSNLYADGYSKLFVAIGSNILRDRLSIMGINQGYKLVNAISPNAVISPTAKLGYGIAVMAGAVINAETIIDDLCIINTGATVDHDCRIGKAVHIGPQSALAGNVVVGDYSLLGIGCKVIPEIIIGERVTIGAGGVVIKNIESNVTAVGTPVHVI